MKLLHTADLQLDAPFTFLGQHGAQHRQQLQRTFGRIVQLAQDDAYDLLLIAGDLFNGNRPAQSTVNFVLERLASLTIPVCILPGNHDCYERASIYRKVAFPRNVSILTERPTYLDFPDLDLTVAGNPLTSRFDSIPSLQNIKRRAGRRWFVVLAHGNLQIPGFIEDTSRPIHEQEITGTDADYVALGDWHAYRDCSQGAVKAYYSGAPEPIDFTQGGAGYVASVTLSDTGVAVQRIRAGRIDANTLDLDVTGSSELDIVQQLRAEAGPNLMLDVTLLGLKALDTYIDPERIQLDLAEDFYCLRVADRSTAAIGAIDPTQFPESHVIGQYIRLMQQQVEQASNEREKRIAEHALQLGFALLQGKEVLR